MNNPPITEIDNIIKSSLTKLAADKHVHNWRAKERDWVNYFVHRYLVENCHPNGPLDNIAQIGIEVSVPQPRIYKKLTVARDVVIWPKTGMTCWDNDWTPSQHPLAIVEWKVHRPGHRNRVVEKERAWLRAYCNWQPLLVAYAVEVEVDKKGCPLTCTRFLGNHEETLWLNFLCS